MMKLRLDRFVWQEYIKISFGVLLLAIALEYFLIPNKIVNGGVSGIATILFHLLDFPVGVSILVMNSVLFLAAFYLLGGGFGVKSIYGSVLLSILIDFMHFYLPSTVFTEDLLIATIFGSLLAGAGLAIVFNQDASTGGTDILARIVNKYTALDMGRALMIFDFTIAASSGLFFKSVDLALYSLFSVFICTRTIDDFIGALNNKKSVMIMTRYPDKILERILSELNRGATLLKAAGGYDKSEKQVILTVVNRRQMVKVRNIVRQEDPAGFVIIGTVSEVLGEGFKKNVA